MKPILTVLLLAPALAFGLKFQDVTAKGSPVSLSVKVDSTDHQPYVVVHNSIKGVLALSAVVNTTDASRAGCAMLLRGRVMFLNQGERWST
jgi:hypothetical protein